MQHFKNTRCYDVTLLHTKHTIFRIYNTNGNAVLIALSASQTLLLVNGRLTSATLTSTKRLGELPEAFMGNRRQYLFMYIKTRAVYIGQMAS